MNNFMNKIYTFFKGRYGVDELYRFLLIICIIILFVNLFFNNIYLKIMEMIIFIVAIYRSLSKNTRKRIKENNIYLDIKKKIKNYFKYLQRRFKDRNTHIYKKCPKCKQKVRLPLKKGKHLVKCPNCNNKFSVRCYRNEKIKVEIVK